ncbi:DUF4157 domain-containing protein [Candidatus Amarolinea dominans]|uniref:eCIS core domain-containing protein n=1 Tax=Candidatus Amarolinea dominans TaxID=3140696 RepID=UPI003135426D|nr:DUF4157 domain-containing protein [Anaerolineae bacterium]
MSGLARTLIAQKAQQIQKPAASGLLQRQCACGNHTVAGGECAACAKKGEISLQRSALSDQPMNGVPPIVYDVLHESGDGLDASTRVFMEERFGHDFSGVRVYTNTRAAESAYAVAAKAYTIGQNVVFGQGRYAPSTSDACGPTIPARGSPERRHRE